LLAQLLSARILVTGSLYLNDKELADIRLLQDTKVTLQTVNRVDNVTVSKVFENV
jgi:hypothetical protein